MSAKFVALMRKIELAIKDRTILLRPKKARDYEKGYYKPFFSLIDRDGKLLCIWCGNRIKPDAAKDSKGDVEILRFREPERGFMTDSQDNRSWSRVTLLVGRHFGIEM